MTSPSSSNLSTGLAIRAFVLGTASFFVSGVVAAGAVVILVMQLGDDRPLDIAGPLVYLSISLVPIWVGIRASRRARREQTRGAFGALAKFSPLLYVVGAVVGGVTTYNIYAGRGTPTVSEADLLLVCESYEARAACQNALRECQSGEFHIDLEAQGRIFDCVHAAMASE